VEWLTEKNRGDDYEFKNSIPSNYIVDERRSDVFYAAIRKYWSAIPDKCLIPDYSGIRPKLYGPVPGPNSIGDQVKVRDVHDFAIEGPETHSVRGLVNLLGMESPGLTSSLAIADHVVRLLKIQKT
jgi:L-2-hydroxyglutarate oxidase LhgO